MSFWLFFWLPLLLSWSSTFTEIVSKLFLYSGSFCNCSLKAIYWTEILELGIIYGILELAAELIIIFF